MAPSGNNAGYKDLLLGGFLQCVEAATLGMPFEVWKTRMGRFRDEGTIQAFRQVYRTGGVTAFWAGLSPKLVESGLKGAVLLYSKELILTTMLAAGISDTTSGFVAGAGAGVAQVSVMSPCTFLVTAVVTGNNSSVTQLISNTWKNNGFKGFYPGGTAVALRQATNWASRQGFTDAVRVRLKVWLHGDERAKLTVGEEAFAGIIGGALSTWNQPFEVARIEMQAAANEGRPKQNIIQVFSMIIKEHGIPGLFKGVIPRIGLGIWQTLFMVSGARMIKDHLQERGML